MALPIWQQISSFNGYFPQPVKPGFAARNKIAADIPFVPAKFMFIETLKSEDLTMASQTLKLNVKTGEKDGKTFWDRFCNGAANFKRKMSKRNMPIACYQAGRDVCFFSKASVLS